MGQKQQFGQLGGVFHLPQDPGIGGEDPKGRD